MFSAINRNLLKSVMLFDGVFSLATAALLATFVSSLNTWLGPLASPAVLYSLSAFFFVWGLFHLVMGRQKMPLPAAVRLAIAGDAIWIVGSLIVVLFVREGLTALGVGVIVIAAVAVLEILVTKHVGLRRVTRLAHS